MIGTGGCKHCARKQRPAVSLASDVWKMKTWICTTLAQLGLDPTETPGCTSAARNPRH